MRKKSQNKKKPYYLATILILVLISFTGLFLIDRYVYANKEPENKITTKKVLVQGDESLKIQKKNFGISEKGRLIEGYEIGQGSEAILLFVAIHGNEMGTTDLLNKLVDDIKTNYQKISPSKKIIIIPMINPDGYYDRTDKLNADGVNLNLNFATSGWQQYGSEGTYAGEMPFSESESQVIKKVVEEYKPKMMISFHSFGSLVTPESNHLPSQELAKWYATKTSYEYFDDLSWDYQGTATKWFVETTNNAAITVELSSNESSDWKINENALEDLVFSDSF